ncbi:hypothetical protein HRbin39_01334 [bacterium HR39]|nr:hypothetical protein HRbin39_01334 [bacterium HR39]
MPGKIAGVFALAIWLAYVGFLVLKVGEIPLLIITAATIVMAAVDLIQTEFQKRAESLRRG